MIVEAEKRIRIKGGVINVYTFEHADLDGVDFYDASLYVNLKN